ncbi:MAG: hypothetical protein PVG89_09705 [Gammaproteobacteria bacterium]|jgi:hypothetical protein
MAFIKNPFRKPAPAKVQSNSQRPAINNNGQIANKGAAPADKKKGLPKNYLDPNSVF